MIFTKFKFTYGRIIPQLTSSFSTTTHATCIPSSPLNGTSLVSNSHNTCKYKTTHWTTKRKLRFHIEKYVTVAYATEVKIPPKIMPCETPKNHISLMWPQLSSALQTNQCSKSCGNNYKIDKHWTVKGPECKIMVVCSPRTITKGTRQPNIMMQLSGGKP